MGGQVGRDNAHMSLTPDRKPQMWNSRGAKDIEANQADPASSQSMSDFVRFFARRELVSSGLLQFNDRPESYRAWKASFLNGIQGQNLTDIEEMDLLVKWLG